MTVYTLEARRKKLAIEKRKMEKEDNKAIMRDIDADNCFGRFSTGWYALVTCGRL